MKLRLICFLLVLPFAARGVEREVARTFPVAPGCALKVDVYRGRVTVTETDAAEVRLEAHLEINTEDETKAERLFATQNFTATAEGNTVTVHAADPSPPGVRLALRDEPTVELDCQIFAPRRCDAEVRVRDGAVTIGNLAGRVVAETKRGNIFIRRIEGSIDARAEAGDVIVSHCTGAVVARTDGGAMRLGTLGGRVELRNLRGNIEVLEAHGALVAKADAGDVTVGFAKDFSADARIETGYGNITAKIDPAANCLVKASSFWSHVENQLPLAIEAGGDGERKLTGRLNGGGPVITLSADGGRVRLVPGETLFATPKNPRTEEAAIPR